MKKLLAVAAGLLAGAAFAGDYHVENTLRCSECHTMHASRTHGLNQAAFEDTYRNIGVMAAPNRNLLIQDGTNNTCLACHDGQAAFPDVLGTNSSTIAYGTGTVRSAGALNSAATSGLPAPGGNYHEFDGHTLGTDAVPPGFVGVYEPSPQENFNCANCHAVHGSWAFRNLGQSRYMGLPGQSGTATNPFATVGPNYNILNEFAVAPGTAGRRAAAATDDVYVSVDTRTYRTNEVAFHQGAGGMNAYCAVCHGYFHGDGNTRDLIGGIDFIRHPTSGVVRDVASGVPLLNFGGQTAQTAFVRPAWVGSGAPAAGANFEAACLSCHKGHGNQNGYGLLYPDNGVASQTNLEDGDAAPSATVLANDTLRNLCVTCHAQGRDLSDPSSR